MTFFSDNKDGLTVLSGLKPNQPVTIQSWKMRSGHPEDKTKYSCDLEERNYLKAGTKAMWIWTIRTYPANTSSASVPLLQRNMMARDSLPYCQ